MKNKIKKLVLKARYVDLELEEVTEIYKTCTHAFNSHVRDMCRERGIPIPGEEPVKKCSSPRHEKKQKPCQVVKQMYRDIAKQVHPDKNKTESEHIKRMMSRATRAKNDNDVSTLLSMCDELDIDVPDVRDKHINNINSKIASKEADIKRMKLSNQWVWYHAEDGDREKYDRIILDGLAK